MELIRTMVETYTGTSVFARIGERSREGHELLLEMRQSGVFDRTVLIFGQMNEPPGARWRVGLSALTIAEYFRDELGRNVLLLMDIVFRFVQAGSEVSGLRHGGRPRSGGAARAGRHPLLPETPAPGIAARDAPRGLVLFMAEHGFTGAFNDQLVDAARRAMSGGEALFVVGGRGRVLIEERGLTPAWATDMAIHAGTVTDTARRVAGALHHRFEGGSLAAVAILYFRDQGGGRRTLERQSLLPVDLARFQPPRSASPPLANLAPQT